MSTAQQIPESLDKEVDHTIEEARMVLPGIQALFGFQLIAVFNNRFATALSQRAQEVHIVALILVAVSIALIMAPAAYHRQAERDVISKHFANYASRLITIAMGPLLVAIAMDVALVTLIVTSMLWVSILVAVALVALFVWLWYVLPNVRRKQRRSRSR